MSKLDALAAHPQVAGRVVTLDSSRPISETYQFWASDLTNPVHANTVAATIQAMLEVTRTAYPDLEYLVIAGGDPIVPFWRIPDEAALANEASYASEIKPDSAIGAALRERFFLSDDLYASFSPLPWRGRTLALPEYGLGRLAETPQEMGAAIDAFLANPTLPATNGLVTGYDFLTDGATAVADALAEGGRPIDRLINDGWIAAGLKQQWLNQRHDINSINAHFDHWQAIPAEQGAGEVLPSDVSASEQLSGTLNYSVGCHSGLSVPDEDALSHGYDFVQAVLGRGGCGSETPASATVTPMLWAIRSN